MVFIREGTRGDTMLDKFAVVVVLEMEETKYDFVPPISSETPAHARSSHGLRGRRTTNSSRPNSHHRDSDSQGSSGSLQGVSVSNGKSKYALNGKEFGLYVT